MKRAAVYPFTAIVGQDDMKMSLILNVINPALGGVLIKGEKVLPSQQQYVLWPNYCRLWKQYMDVNFIVIRQIPICYEKIVHLNIRRIIN